MMMKKILKYHKGGGERGIILLSALVFLAIGTIMLIPLLGYMNTGLKAERSYENKMEELYGADAGVEDAIWQVRMIGPNNPINNPISPERPHESEYVITDVNGNDITVYIWKIDRENAMVTSTASGGTSITAFITPLGYWGDIMDNAITSPGDINIGSNVLVDGDVQYNGAIDNKGVITGEEDTSTIAVWPTTSYILEHYQNLITTTSVGTQTINITSGTEASPVPIGPMYIDGDLNITVTGTTGWAKFTGLVYVTGNVNVAGKANIILEDDLQVSHSTIFSEGTITFQPGSNVHGPGCVVALGDITYQPNDSGDGFIFIMSLEGTIDLSPNGDFYGSVAGNCEVGLQPGTVLTHPGVITEDLRGALDFPTGFTGDDVGAMWGVMSWEIS